MGIFFDLMQQAELDKQQKQADGLEDRLRALEIELKQTNEVLRKTLQALELHLGEDVDGDGVTG